MQCGQQMFSNLWSGLIANPRSSMRSYVEPARGQRIQRSTVAIEVRSALSRSGDTLTFVIPISGAFVFHTVGELPIATVIMCLLLPFMMVSYPRRLRSRNILWVLILLALWLAGQIVTDVWRGTEIQDWMRADARIGAWSIDLVGLSILVGGSIRRQVIFSIGFALGLALEVTFQPTDYTDFWKFGYSAPITTISLLLASVCHRYRWWRTMIVILFGVTALHACLGYRAGFLCGTITTGLMAGSRLLPRLGNHHHKRDLLSLSTMALVAGGCAATVVLGLAQRGILREQSGEKSILQSEAVGGILLGGRPEMLVSSLAVLDSPIIGHGAWARDDHYMDLYKEMRSEHGIPEGERDDFGPIPTHSHLMGSWMEAGICGAMLWFYLLLLVVRGTLLVSLVGPQLAPLYVYNLISLAWAILFSPLGGVTALPEAFTIVAICSFLENRSCGLLQRARPDTC